MTIKKENNVRFIRLINGDDIISEVSAFTKSTTTVRKPMLILNNIELEEGKQTLILYPWIIQGVSLGNTATIRNVNILISTKIEPDILDYYEGIVEIAFAEPPSISSTSPRISDKGKNVISFEAASILKNKKDIS